MSLDYKIVKMKKIRVVGYYILTTTEDNACMEDIPKLWNEVVDNNKHLELLSMMNQEPQGLMGVSIYNIGLSDSRKFIYMIASSTDKKPKESMMEYTIPAASWAALACDRSELVEVQNKVINKWQLSSGYKVLNSGYNTGKISSIFPDIELYLDENEAQVWVAVEKE